MSKPDFRWRGWDGTVEQHDTLVSWMYQATVVIHGQKFQGVSHTRKANLRWRKVT